jgi:NitT/TauT family transport system permease protein
VFPPRLSLRPPDDADPTSDENTEVGSAGEDSQSPRIVIQWRNTLGARRRPYRGQRQHAAFRIGEDIPRPWRLSLLGIGFLAPLLVWLFVAQNASSTTPIPTPNATWEGLRRLVSEGVLWGDLWASNRRILIGYAISMVVAVLLGVLMGAFRSVESLLEPPIGFLRYVPATALVPLMIFWLGIDVADMTRQVPKELVNAAYTLGAKRRTVVRRVILPHSVPGIIDVARINLAAAWSILVVAELLAAQSGLAFRITRAQRFRQVDEMFALLIVFGAIGVISDLSLRWFRNRTSPWARP